MTDVAFSYIIGMHSMNPSSKPQLRSTVKKYVFEIRSKAC